MRTPTLPDTLITPAHLPAMRAAGRLVAEAHAAVAAAVAPGVTTRELDAIAEAVIRAGGGQPAFKGFHGFPAAVCASPNEVVVHGFPNRRKLVAGDVVSIDIGAIVEGHYGDSAWTYAVGEVAPEVRRLLTLTEAGLHAGIAAARAGATIEDVSAAVEDVIAPAGLGLVRDFCGHGIGRVLHGSPQVPNFRSGRRGPALVAGQGLAIEPMVTLGGAAVRTKADGWTVVTRDGSWAAHFEHTVVVTEGAAIVTTRL